MKELTEDEFYRLWPQDAIIAEIGVWFGNHADSIRQRCHPRELWLIDPWTVYPGGLSDSQTDYDNGYAHVCVRFPAQFILKMSSLEAAKKFPEQYFDVVYIDGCHAYESVLADCEAYYPLVKVGGLLCGHDYVEAKHLGVVPAVTKYREIHNLSLHYVTTHGWKKWGIIRE